MRQIARLPAQERYDVFLIAANTMGVTPAILEKDFWVCYVLDYLFQRSPKQSHLVFKGGTSLSKCYHLIQRFSEDVDLILDWRELGYDLNEPWEVRSHTKQEQFKKNCTKRTNDYLHEVFIPILQHELSEELDTIANIYAAREAETIIFDYPRVFSPSGALNHIRLEIGPLAAWTPTEHTSIRSYISEQLPNLIQEPSFLVKTVRPERTFWEKATILHQEANRPANKSMLPRYSRHYYDLFQMSLSDTRDHALNNFALLDKVVCFKEKFYRTPWANLSQAKPGSLQLVPSKKRIQELSKDYAAMKEMLIGETPSLNQIIMGLEVLQEEINSR